MVYNYVDLALRERSLYMDPIYVTGHRNPDTDSIVAAMAYAALRNALGDREYEGLPGPRLR